MADWEERELEVWRKIAEENGLRELRDYKSACRLTTKNGIWARKQLEQKWSDLPWAEIQSLTELPEESRREILEYLKKWCTDTDSKSSGPSGSYRKKLSAAIGYLLKRKASAVSGGGQGELQQEGKFCFVALLQTWQAAATPEGCAPWRKGIDWLQSCFPPAEGSQVQLTVRSQPLQGCKSLSQSDCAELKRCLSRGAAGLRGIGREKQEAAIERFHARKNTLTALREKLQEAALPENTSAVVRREWERLRILEQYWDDLYVGAGGKTKREGKLCFLQIFFALLYGSLGGENWDWLQSRALTASTGFQDRFLSAVSYAGIPLASEMTAVLLKDKSGSESEPGYYTFLYRLPEAGAELTWTERDLGVLWNHPALLSQLKEVSAEIQSRLEDEQVLGNPLRRSALLALARLLLCAAEARSEGGLPEEARQAVEESVLNFLPCWETPEQRIRLINLLNPEWSRRKEGAERTGLEPLSRMFREMADISLDYIGLLRAGLVCAGLEPGRRLQLEARMKYAEIRLPLVRQLLEAASPLEYTPAGEGLRPAPVEAALWREETGGDYLRPYASSAFDSVRGFGPQETQLELVSLLYRSARVVLTAPQVVDNPQLLELIWKSPAFLELLRLGRVTVSLYSQYQTLRGYAADILEKTDGFVFSGYRIFQQEETWRRDYLRHCMANFLRAEDRGGRIAALRQAPFEVWDELERYGLAICTADEALAAQTCGGPFRTLGAFFHQQSGWRCAQGTPSSLLEGMDRYLKSHLSDRQDLRQLHEGIRALGLRDTRSAIYDALKGEASAWGLPECALEEYRVLTDLLYFEHNSARITGFLEHRVDRKYQKIMPGNQHGGPVSLSVGYLQAPAGAESHVFTLEELVDFVREADRFVAANSKNLPAEAILNGVLCRSSAVQIVSTDRGLPRLQRLVHRVTDPVQGGQVDICQEASAEGSFLTLERRS